MSDLAQLHPLLNPGESITEALERQAAEIERLQEALLQIAEFSGTEPWRLTAKTLRQMAREALEA